MNSVQWKISELRTAEKNPRTITKARLEDLKRSLKSDPEFLKVRPIIVQTRGERRGVIVGGTMRYLAAIELGWSEVSVLEIDTDEATENRWRTRDNSHWGEWDNEMLAELVMLADDKLEHGLPSDKLDEIMNAYGPETQENEEDQVEALAAKPDPITKPGDLWRLGDHLIFCGDACDSDSYVKLFGDEKATMCWTDPPYNVDYGGGGRAAIRGEEKRVIENDKMGPQEWAGFVRAWMERLHERTKGAVYICMSTKEWPSVHKAFIEAGFHWSDTIVWAKHCFTLGRSDYQRQHEPILVGKPKLRKAEMEPILYGWPNGIDHIWNGGRDEGDVWFFKRPTKNPIHPTMKPVELVAKAISLSSNRGDTVLDAFAGGGSTLIACERTKRKARLIELSPGYCDAEPSSISACQ